MTLILAAVAWLLTYLLHSTVLLVGAFVLASLGVVRSAAARDTMWKVAMVGGLLTATAQTALRLQPWAGHVALAAQSESPFVDVAGIRDVRVTPTVPAAPESTPAGAAFASAISQRPMSELPPLPAVRSRTVHRLVSGLHVSWPAMLLQLWFMGSLGLGVWLVWVRFDFARRLRWRRPLENGPLSDSLTELCAAARVPVPMLTVSDRLAGPIAFGREICIPERVVTSLEASQQRAVLAHELGHVVRKDPAWLMAAACIETVCFMQPLNRLARRRLREVAEYLCDDWAAERTDGVVLARCLAEVAGWVHAEPAPAAVAGMASRCSQLVNRVERLLEGAAPTRPSRWVIRAGVGAVALALVATAVPGVAAEDIDYGVASGFSPAADVVQVGEGPWQGSGWGEVRDDGHLIAFAPGWAARLAGQGRLGFREYGRAIAIPDDYVLSVGGHDVTDDVDLAVSGGVVRIVGPDGSWTVTPVRLAGAPAYASSRRSLDELATLGDAVERRAGDAIARAEAVAEARALSRSHADADVVDSAADAATDTALGGEADAAIDTLVQLWVRDPEAVRRAARRIARTYDHELRPQFESLGVEVGRQLAPELQRLTGRVGRDLSPEFARLGAALGASIVQSLGEPETYGAGQNDQSGKKRPVKTR